MRHLCSPPLLSCLFIDNCKEYLLIYHPDNASLMQMRNHSFASPFVTMDTKHQGLQQYNNKAAAQIRAEKNGNEELKIRQCSYSLARVWISTGLTGELGGGLQPPLLATSDVEETLVLKTEILLASQLPPFIQPPLFIWWHRACG